MSLYGIKRKRPLITLLVIGTVVYLYLMKRVPDSKKFIIVASKDELKFARGNADYFDLVVKTPANSVDRSDLTVGTPVENFTAVIILTYMRSGSSLMGEILQQDPDAFYVFEPLRSLTSSFKHEFQINFLNGTSVDYGRYNWTDIAIPTLRAWLTCDIENVPERGLFDAMFMGYGRKTAAFQICLRQHHFDTVFLKINFCVKRLREACLASKYKVIKTIRTAMVHIKDLVAAIPQLKVLHLVRDPRDTMNSQKKKGNCGKKTPEDLQSCAAKYCNRLSEDIYIKEKEKVFENRVLTVRFEDIAFQALEVSSDIYRFLGMKFKEHIRNYVYNLTSDESKDGCFVCQKKWQVGQSTLNASTHVEKWRTNMPKEFRVIVDKFCKESILHPNYSFLNNAVPTELPVLNEET